MDEATKTEAGCRSFEILTAILEEHEDVYVSIACTGRLLAHGTEAVVNEVRKTIKEWETKDPSELAQYIDLLPVNPAVALVRADPAEVFLKVERQMSISALITAHAFFESIVTDLLRLTLFCDREKWMPEISSKNVTLGEVLSGGIDVCAEQLLEKELKKIALAGMPALVARLLNFCKGNVTTKTHFQNYALDLQRLKQLDQRRHDYAHRVTKAPYSIREAEIDLRYLTLTAIHLTVCIMESYNLKGQHRRA